MENYANTRPFAYVPTDTADLIYPESDGKPMAETDTHIYEIIRMRHMLKAHFAQQSDVYISGNIMMYYKEGNIHASVSPDILVSFGVGKKRRRTYKIWEEGKPPDFVLEFSSKGTYRDDLGYKAGLYAEIGISEYFLYDAERLYLLTPLICFRLVDGSYVDILERPDGGFFSETLGLTFYSLDDSLGVYDPEMEKWVRTPAEAAEERAEASDERAEAADERAEASDERAEVAEERAKIADERAEAAEERAEASDERAKIADERAKTAEAEVERLREELKRGQSTPTSSK